MFVCSNTDLIELVLAFGRVLRPEVYLELGIWKGQTISEMTRHAKRCIGVDVTKPDVIAGYEFHWMSTDTFFKTATIPPLDLTFIDADHSYEHSERDFENALQHTVDGGLILLHDTFPGDESYLDPKYCGDSYKTAWRIRHDFRHVCEIVTIPHHPGLSIVRKSTKQIPWIENC